MPSAEAGGGLADDDLPLRRPRWQRHVVRTIGLVLAIALVVPFAAGLAQWLGFRRAGDDVVAELASDDLDAALGESVLLVAATGCAGGTRVTGSAFVAEVDGRPAVITNAHVIEDVAAVGLQTLRGEPGPLVTGWRRSTTADVALLEIEFVADARPSALALASTDPEPGDRVRTVGFPAAWPNTTLGTVAQSAGGTTLMDMEVAPGASGSPVLDGEGRVVAQVRAVTGAGQGVATPVGSLRRALAALEPVESGC